MTKSEKVFCGCMGSGFVVDHHGRIGNARDRVVDQHEGDVVLLCGRDESVLLIADEEKAVSPVATELFGKDRVGVVVATGKRIEGKVESMAEGLRGDARQNCRVERVLKEAAAFVAEDQGQGVGESRGEASCLDVRRVSELSSTGNNAPAEIRVDAGLAADSPGYGGLVDGKLLGQQLQCGSHRTAADASPDSPAQAANSALCCVNVCPQPVDV